MAAYRLVTESTALDSPTTWLVVTDDGSVLGFVRYDDAGRYRTFVVGVGEGPTILGRDAAARYVALEANPIYLRVSPLEVLPHDYEQLGDGAWYRPYQ